MKIIVSESKSKSRTVGKSGQSGFTLWELLVVLFLMGVLLTSVTPHFGSAARLVGIRVDLANVQKIEGAAQLYRIDVGTYPASVSDLFDAPRGASGWRGPYLNEIPTDPFDSTESYLIDAFGQVK